MARMSIDIPKTIKKIEPKTGTLRRTSTGNSSIKINEPNYLRVSTGSCHDICKYDIKRAFAVKPWRPVGRILDKNVNVSLDKNHRRTRALTSPKVMSKPKTCKSVAFSRTLDKNVYVSLDKDHRRKNALTSPKAISVSLVKPKTFKTDQVAPKQPIRTLLTSSSDKRESRNDAGKEAKTPKKSNSPKRTPSAKSRTGKKDSQAEIKNKTCSSGNVVEKIIHVVIEPEDECRNKSPAQESHINCTGFPTLSSNQESNNRKKAIEGAVPEENYSTPKKIKLNRGKVPVMENAVSQGKVNHKKNDVSIGGVVRHDQRVGWKNGDSVLLNIVIEERASNLQVKMRKTKVEALVGAFQSVISSNTPQDYTPRS